MNRYILTVVLILGIVVGGYLGLPVFNRLLGLPDLRSVIEYHPISSIELYDYRDNFVGFLQGEEDRQVISISEVSPYLKRAVLAIEDKDFYRHFGIDPVGIFRAFFVNLKAGKIIEGGSTITQQLVKNLLIPIQERRRTFTRKIKEILLALELERKVNKDKILELYLNQIFWGRRAYGIQRAAQRYFNKSATDLNLAESAYLAGLLKAPSKFSSDFNLGKQRQELVLEKMLEFGFITKEQYNEALKYKLEFSSGPGNLEKYPYYFSYVLEKLKERFNLEEIREKGYKVYTGLDPVAQDLAEKILNEEVKNTPYGVSQLALVALDVKTSQVRALVGGVGNFWEHQWNRATNPHTIGSAFKPFVYLAAFEEGLIGPETIVKDSRIQIEDGPNMIWKPRNFDKRYWGKITVTKALTFSRNIPAVKVAKHVGIEKVIKVARACGIESKLEPVLALSLGSAAISPLEAASSYATFARNGIYIRPILIRKIEDPKGRVIEENNPVPRRAVSAQATATLVGILKNVVQAGTGTQAKLEDRVVAGKTGTSDESRDVWFIGFTPDLTCAIWGGNDENLSIKGKHITGGAIVARIWNKFAKAYYEEKDIPSTDFPPALGMKELLIDPLTGLLATEYTPNPVRRRFLPGTEPTEYAPVPDSAKKLNPFTRLMYGPFLSRFRNNELPEDDTEISSEASNEVSGEGAEFNENELVEEGNFKEKIHKLRRRIDLRRDAAKIEKLQEKNDEEVREPDNVLQ